MWSAFARILRLITLGVSLVPAVQVSAFAVCSAGSRVEKEGVTSPTFSAATALLDRAWGKPLQ
jgi:hypothetical protein